MVTVKDLENGEEETLRFLRKLHELKTKLATADVNATMDINNLGCRESAAFKRASQDLSCVLIEMRKK